VKEIAPDFAETVKPLLFEVATVADTVIFAPEPSPLIPVLLAVVLSVVFETSVTALDIVMAFAVRIVPLRLTELGAATVKEPKTKKLSPAASFSVKLPVLLKTKL
jgi:hypothetical protein